MNHWYVVHVLSSHEKKVKKTIEEKLEASGMSDFIKEVVVPIENVSEVKKGQQKVVEKRIWPGYILVNLVLNDESWGYIKETQGVIGFLGGGKPTPLSDYEVQEILRDIQEKGQKVTQKHKFAVGDSVKIIDGVFVNFIGTVFDVNNDKGQLSVRVSIFGRDTEVDDLEFHQVEKVEDEA
ncbi:MAG: transcription termination/antitermination protein NusG [Waddliaceae bacterium]